MPTPAPAAPAGTPLTWRLGLLAAVAAVGGLAYLVHGAVGPRGQAACGVVCFLGLVAACSADLRRVNYRTLAWGIALQVLLAVLVIYVQPVRDAIDLVGNGVKKLLEFSKDGATFVFGSLADPGGPNGFVFAFVALPPIIFVSAFFSLLYYFGVLQLLVKGMARGMMFLMRTSGAETLSVAANVFMGQTEAPLIVRPFVPRMTKSELLSLMASGMAHISGGMMAVYISYGADPVAILTTCVMACPCSLYLAKLLLPETEKPETLGTAPVAVDMPHPNPIDALASGVTVGLKLALNVAAMLIAFLAVIAMLNAILGAVKPALLWAGHDFESSVEAGLAALGLLAAGVWLATGYRLRRRRPVWGSVLVAAGAVLLMWANRRGFVPLDDPAVALGWWPDDLSLQFLLGWVFRPVAFLIGVDPNETGQVGTLLGIKLVLNEHVAYVTLTKDPAYHGLSRRSRLLAVYALTGFANFASVGIQLGGIGAMAPERRADLARLGLRALFVGFVATLVNAAVAGMLMPDE